jgi:hypothetical protein
MKHIKSFALVAAMGMAPVFAQAAVVNGSFEIGPTSAGLNNGNSFASMPGASGTDSWDRWNNTALPGGFPGWTTDGDGIEIQTVNTVGLTPYDGDYYAELDSNSNSTIFQSIMLGVGNYVLSFAYSPRVDGNGGPGTNEISYSIANNANTAIFGDVNGPGIDGTVVGAWTYFTFNFFNAVAGEYTLTFDASTRSDSFGGFIDAIDVAPVPVPAAGLLLLGALGGLAAMRRRKTAA